MSEQCEVMADWEPPNMPGSLMLRKDEVISVIGKGNDSGWWEGMDKDGNRGVFPNCFVLSNPHGEMRSNFVNKAMAIREYKPSSEAEMHLKPGDVITVCGKGPGTSSFWWGIKDGKSTTGPTSSDRQLFPPSHVSCKIVRASYEFGRRFPHELSFQAGEVILVHRRWNDGWWEGKSGSSESTGIFPSNYTAPNAAVSYEGEPLFFCNTCKEKLEGGTCAKCAMNSDHCLTMLANLDRYFDEGLEQGLFSTEDLEGYIEHTKENPINLFEDVELELE